MVSTELPPATLDNARPRGLTEQRVLLCCLWSAPVFVVLLFAGLLLAGFVPPPSPTLSAPELAARYAERTDLARLGFLLLFLGGGLTAALVAVIDHELRRIPGARALAVLQVIGGTLGVIAVSGPAIVFLVAAFRPERDPQITLALHDLAMIPFIGNLVPFVMQAVAIGVAVLMQQPAAPRPDGTDPSQLQLPRWFGFYTLWTGFLTLPGLLLVFFHDGAFALNGVMVFWMPATIFGGWFFVTFAVLRGRLLGAWPVVSRRLGPALSGDRS